MPTALSLGRALVPVLVLVHLRRRCQSLHPRWPSLYGWRASWQLTSCYPGMSQEAGGAQGAEHSPRAQVAQPLQDPRGGEGDSQLEQDPQEKEGPRDSGQSQDVDPQGLDWWCPGWPDQEQEQAALGEPAGLQAEQLQGKRGGPGGTNLPGTMMFLLMKVGESYALTLTHARWIHRPAGM
uniref:Putative secreted protein n=1 Tax=Ixodes ricinus TaxID=34613 RepID=A0A6B0UYW1_IXORI